MNTPTDHEKIALPDDFEEKAKQRFEKIEDHDEITFDQYLEHEKAELRRLKAVENNPALSYRASARLVSPCGNGDFEQSLDPAHWDGAYGSLPLTATNPFASFTAGLFPGNNINDGINDSNSHQRWVGSGNDTILANCIPSVTLSTTAQGSSGAVRIGNAVNGCGCELLSKTFIVTPAVSTITFWYAVVLQNPVGHAANIQPFFWVRVTDASGNIVPGAFSFNNPNSPSPDKLIADTQNPFFQTTTTQNREPVVYKDWSCAQIDLSTQIGQQVTIEFVTGDCGACGHWGYAYIDNFCGDCRGSPTGDLTYNCEHSTHCGTGQLCFDYSLPTTKDPKTGNVITGSLVINLDIYQNGILLTTIPSSTLTTGTSFCFPISPTTIAGINLMLGGFDFVATGTFAIGNTSLGQIRVGNAPDGIKSGRNNDYQIACKTCEEIKQEQEAYLNQQCAYKVNLLHRANCDCPQNIPHSRSDCNCDCSEVTLPNISPCITVKWGDSSCDCMETDDVEVLCITVCNCYSNVTFHDLSIGHIVITDMDGNPVPTLPDGTPSVQVIPSGPICFGDIGPCKDPNKPSCVSRELVLYTRGAIGKSYVLSFEGICFDICYQNQSKQCFIVNLCQD